MNTKNIWSGIVIAALLAAAAAIFEMLLPTIGTAFLFAIVVWSYLGFLLWKRTVAGKFTLLVFLAALFATSVLSSNVYTLMFFAGTIWIIRAALFCESAIAALIDLGIIFLGWRVGSWCLAETGSVPLACWTFFLTQAAHIWIPSNPIEWLKARKQLAPTAIKSPRKFDEALNTAGKVIARMSSVEKIW